VTSGAGGGQVTLKVKEYRRHNRSSATSSQEPSADFQRKGGHDLPATFNALHSIAGGERRPTSGRDRASAVADHEVRGLSAFDVLNLPASTNADGVRLWRDSGSAIRLLAGVRGRGDKDPCRRYQLLRHQQHPDVPV
jgi:hypothetical protein